MSYGKTWQRSLYYRLPGFFRNAAATLYGRRERKLRHGLFYAKYFQAADELQWLNGDALEIHCLEKMRRFLANAESDSPFYRLSFAEHSFRPEELDNMQALSRLPILGKEELRTKMGTIVNVSGNDADLHWVHTSGTTGLGLKFPETKECFQREYAYRFHNYAQGGIAVGDRWAICAGHPVADPKRRKPPFWVYDRSNNWMLMSSCHMTEDNLRGYIAELAKFKPDLIGGYPSSIYLLALANEHLGRPVTAKAIYTASETLFDFQRVAINRSFGCAVRSYYGNAERCGFMAECERGVMHAKQEHSYVEILGEDGLPVGPGCSGKIVVTGYGNSATPLVRYDVGDVGVVSKQQSCPCGRGGLLLDAIVGRTEDYIVTPDGRLVGRLDHLFKDASNVRCAQLFQATVDSLEIRVVRTKDYGSSDEAAILHEARMRLGPQIQIRFSYVDSLERTRSGKLKFIVSALGEKRMFGRRVEEAGGVGVDVHAVASDENL